MRKTQFALAALALVASSAALAEGVTVYGTADISLMHTDNGTVMGGAGNSAGSIIGFKGSEDLGGGLKATFNLEAGYSGNTGSWANGGDASGSALFNRAANVGISNGVLGVTLGTQISPFIAGELTGATGVGGNGVFVPGLNILNGGNLANNDSSPNGFFINNAVSASANVSGVSVNVLTRALGGSSINTDNDKYLAGNIGATLGNINVNLSYQDMTNSGLSGTNTVFAANTMLGEVRINGAYANNGGVYSSTGYMIGASMPLMGAISGGLTYARNNHSNSQVVDVYSAHGRTMTSVALQYTFSKSTFAYATYNHFSEATILSANDGSGGSTKSNVIVGLAKSF